VHPHFSGNCSQYFVTIFEAHPEHSIGERFYDCSIFFDEILFRHTEFGSAKIVVFIQTTQNFQEEFPENPVECGNRGLILTKMGIFIKKMD